MKNLRLNWVYLVLGFISFLLTWLFVGVFRDDEFYEPNLFTKHRPRFKLEFYSPIGMQDQVILPPDKQEEEAAFQEFVIKQGIQNNSNAWLWYMPEILIQLTLTMLMYSLYQKRESGTERVWLASAIHFAVNYFITAFSIGFVLVFDRVYSTILISSAILTINYFSASLLMRAVAVRKA